VGPKPSRMRSSRDGPGGGSAETSTFLSVSSSHRLSLAANWGRRVLNRVTSWVWSLTGTRTGFLKSPSMASSIPVTEATLPASTWARNSV
jgi:hypothetical protein